MTSIKTFIIGALTGALVGAIFLGPISHLAVVALVVAGAGAVALGGRHRRLSARRSREDLNT